MKSKWPASVREAAYAASAPKQTVSLTINSDLMTRVKALGINASRIAEEALAAEVDRQRRAVILAEVEADMQAMNAYVAKHGDPAEMVRQHYENIRSRQDGED